MQFSTVSTVALFALAKVALAENKAAAISQITDGQIQAGTATATATATATHVSTQVRNSTATVSHQTENGAAKTFVGFGAGVAAVAALLL